MTHNTCIKWKEIKKADGKNQQHILKLPHKFKQNGGTQAAVVAVFISRYTEYTCQAYTQACLHTHTDTQIHKHTHTHTLTAVDIKWQSDGWSSDRMALITSPLFTLQ